jgi:hypothetical protein
MMTKRPPDHCRTRTIASGSLARIEACDHCECLSVHIGVISVRMDRDALRDLYRTLGKAVATLASESALKTTTSFRGQA